MKSYLFALATLLVYQAILPGSQADSCRALQSIANNLTILMVPNINFTCTVPEQANRPGVTCNQVYCRTPDGETLVITVLPCQHPPAINLRIADSSDNTLFNHTFNHSEVVPFTLQGVPLKLNVTLNHINSNGMEAIGLKVELIIPLSAPRTIVPYTIIPIDTTSCAAVTPSVSPTTSSSTLTCQSLRDIASQSQYCSTVGNCTVVDCSPGGPYHVLMEVVPCNQPPAIRITVLDESTNTVYVNQTLSHSGEIPVRIGGFQVSTVDVTIQQSTNNDAITVKVDLLVLGGSTIPLIPETTIPIDTSHCPLQPTTTPAPTSGTPSEATPSSVGTTAIDTEEPSVEPTEEPTEEPTPVTATAHTAADLPSDEPADTSEKPTDPTEEPTAIAEASSCEALQNISDAIMALDGDSSGQVQTCIAPENNDGSCNTVKCTALDGSGAHLDITLLPCSDPPGFRMVSQTKDTHFDHTFTKSATVSFPLGSGLPDVPLNVTVNHLNGGTAIGIAAGIEFFGISTMLVPYTVVPLDTRDCKGGHKKSVPLAVAIAVPIGVILLLVVLVVLVAVLLCGRYRRGRQYQFEPMSMSSTDKEEEDA